MDDLILKKLNFASWLEFYEYLRELGWHEKARIRMHPHSVEEVGGEPGRSRNHPYEFDLVEIKARAFDEIYELFPRAMAVDVMLEAAHDAAREVPAAEILIHFFNKLKIRKV